jgi:hypothetical protein
LCLAGSDRKGDVGRDRESRGSFSSGVGSTGEVVRMRGLPYSATVGDIMVRVLIIMAADVDLPWCL